MMRVWSKIPALGIVLGLLVASAGGLRAAEEGPKSKEMIKKGAGEKMAAGKMAAGKKMAGKSGGMSKMDGKGMPAKGKGNAKEEEISVAASSVRDVSAKDREIVAFIDQMIRKGWEENEVQPSAKADDAEWMRRAYLDLVGHVPPLKETEEFLADKSENKREVLVGQLLKEGDYVRHMTTVWTNLLIGRVTPDRTSRAGLQKFLREAFSRGRPWNEVVYDLITAEGHYEENGAVNFLLAHLQGNPNAEDYSVEATARLTRIFLGMQVQCTQCHNHPFNDWKQEQFWQFNSFLRQVQRVDHDRYDAQSGRNVDDYSELAMRNFNGPVHYETRSALMLVAYPAYFGKAVAEEQQSNRRTALGKFVCHQDEKRVMAKAMVNRTWGQFFGYGFTRPIDDMGPHNAPTHPELLEKLAEEFVASGYDMRKLMWWICNSEAYQLSSQMGEKNGVDNPAEGEVPLFSHMYVKALNAEQLYDSLIVATGANQVGAGGFEAAQQKREQWLRDFLVTFGGDDDDDVTAFNGTIPQALLLMNGPMIEAAVSAESGSVLHAVLTDGRSNDVSKVKRLYLASLGRNPSSKELNQAGRMMQGSGSREWGYQDLYWALLNSNEFVLNH